IIVYVIRILSMVIQVVTRLVFVRLGAVLILVKMDYVTLIILKLNVMLIKVYLTELIQVAVLVPNVKKGAVLLEQRHFLLQRQDASQKQRSFLIYKWISEIM